MYSHFLGLGVMPLQLLNLGVIIPRFISRIFWVRTPRGKLAQRYSFVRIVTGLGQKNTQK
jgi:hypothetical protein